MADKIVCWRCADFDNDGGNVPALAYYIENWGVVSFDGVFGIDRSILRHGYCSIDTFLCDCLYGTTWTLVVSKFV